MSDDLIRDELWLLVESDVDGGNFDNAISTAFRYLESTIQAMSGITSFGSQLIESTFGAKIVISRNSKDDESLRNLFKGAIGFFKGSRSHGSKPIVPVGDRPQCLRVLAAASALLDLLDYDESRRPQIVSYRQSGESIEFQSNNVGPDTRCFVNGAEVRIVNRRAGVLSIDARVLSDGQHTASLQDGTIASVDFQFEVLPERPLNWHRVLQADISLYADSAGHTRRPEVGVLLESYEAGRVVPRCFPTKQQYQASEYVSWDWSTAPGLAETWISDPAGNIVSAWLGSSFFDGHPTKAKYSPRVVGIRLHPQRHVYSSRIGETLPLMLEEQISDGVGSWDSLSVSINTVTSNDVRVVYVVDHAKSCLRAKNPGSATLQVQDGAFFAQTTVDVVALQSGAVLKFLGGIKHAAGVAYSPRFGLFITNQTNTIYQVSTDSTFKKFTDVGPSYLATPGLDNIAIADDGTVFVRSLGTRSVIGIDVNRPDRVSDEITLGDERTPIGHCVSESVLFITDHRGRVWEYKDKKLSPVCDLVPDPDSSFTLTQIAADNDHLWVLDNRTGFYAIDRGSGMVTVATRPGTANQFSAILPWNGRFLLSDFHAGKIASFENGNLIDIASGLDNPSAMTAGDTDTIFVANFGTEGIARVVV